MEKSSLKKNFLLSETEKSNNTIKRRFSTNNDLMNIRLPNLQNFFKNNLISKKDNKINNQKLSNNLERKSTRYYSDHSLDNSNNSIDLNSGYKSSSNKNLTINENEDYFQIYQKKKMSRNNILVKKNIKDLSCSQSNSSTQKKNRTIINIYNTSVKNSPKIFLFSSLLTSSTSVQNSSNNINPLKKNNKVLNVNKKKVLLPSMGNLRFHYHYKTINNHSQISLKKNIKSNSVKKEAFKLNLDKLNKSIKLKIKSKLKKKSVNKDNKDNKDHKDNKEKIKKKKTFKDGPDYNENLRNKFIKKNMKEKDNNQFQKKKEIFFLNSTNKLKKSIKNTIIEKIEEQEQSFELILNDFKQEVFKEQDKKSLNKFEKYIFKKIIQKHKQILFNKIPDSIPGNLIKNYFENDFYYLMLNTFLNSISLKHCKNTSYQSIKSLETQKYGFDYQYNFYFLLERFIKNDLVLTPEENIIYDLKNEKSKYKNMIKETKNYLNKKKKTKRKYSIYNKIKLPYTILNTNYFIRKKEKINIDRRVSFIRRLRFKNISQNKKKTKIKLLKNKSMTKESLIFRTEEIKIQLKENLNTIEEILFFLIKENNFREFQDIQERFQVSLESKNETEDTFLIYASKCEKEDFVKFLIEKGAFINAQNNELNTPLHYALSNKNYKISDMLLKAGADEKIVNKINLSPWEYKNVFE